MTLFKGHFQRRASSRARNPSSDSTTHSPKKRTEETAADIELRELIRQAVDATTTTPTPTSDLTIDHHNGPFKMQPSLFQRLMKRKGNPAGLDASSDKTSRLSRQNRQEVLSIDIDKETRSRTPDLVSDGGYDSDAQFIPSPRFSSQSWESLHPLSPRHTHRSSGISRILSSEEKFRAILSDDGPVLSQSFQRQRPSSLALPKRRSAAKPLTLKSRAHSLRPADFLQSHESHTSHNNLVDATSPETKSKFTELFNLRRTEVEVSKDSTRKVSIGWMSEGRRYGYGYSFVESDGADNVATEIDCTSNDCKETKATNSSENTPLHSIQATKDETKVIDIKVRHKEAVRLSAGKQETIDTKTISTWSYVPSHSKTQTNQSATFEDGVIVRDFCTRASPDRPQQSYPEEKKHQLISDAIRQGLSDAMLSVFGLGKREIARYHAGLGINAARSHDHSDPQLEATIPSRGHVPKEELGDHHIEAWRVARRRSRQRRASTKSQLTIRSASTPTSTARTQLTRLESCGNDGTVDPYFTPDDGIQLSTFTHSNMRGER